MSFSTVAQAAFSSVSAQAANSGCASRRLPPTALLRDCHSALLGQYGSEGRTRWEGDMTRAAAKRRNGSEQRQREGGLEQSSALHASLAVRLSRPP